MVGEGVRLTFCLLCKKKRVNEFLLSTLEPPNDLPIIGDTSFVQVSCGCDCGCLSCPLFSFLSPYRFGPTEKLKIVK